MTRRALVQYVVMTRRSNMCWVPSAGLGGGAGPGIGGGLQGLQGMQGLQGLQGLQGGLAVPGAGLGGGGGSGGYGGPGAPMGGPGGPGVAAGIADPYGAAAQQANMAAGRGLHSSTPRLKVSAFSRIGGSFRGCSGGF